MGEETRDSLPYQKRSHGKLMYTMPERNIFLTNQYIGELCFKSKNTEYRQKTTTADHLTAIQTCAILFHAYFLL